MTSSPPPRTSRAEAARNTRTALADAAVDLVKEHGYRDTTVEQIAERAGVSPRTFFRHFPTKEAALFAQEDRFLSELTRQLEAQPAGDPPLRVTRRALTAVAALIQADSGWLLDVIRFAEEVPAIRDRAEHGVPQRIRATVLAWAERRLGVPAVADPAPLVLASAVAGCVEAAMRRWLAHHGRVDLPLLVGESFDALAHLATDA